MIESQYVSLKYLNVLKMYTHRIESLKFNFVFKNLEGIEIGNFLF